NVDQFRWLVRRDMQEQLRVAHEEIGARHVRAVGMFDDEMRVLALDPTTWRDKKRTPRLNWQIVDYVIESLLELGLKPMFTTTFVPTALASGTQTVFSTRSNVTPPRDLAAWSQLVETAVRHAIEQFGAAEVRQWYFEVWNEPNLTAFWAGTREQFHALWQATYRAIKNVDAALRVGGPSTARAEWL
ncbi:MAG: hypothetical protein N3I86_16520, partial [Verrucomicrobiae bacterium]|nr:hypothetical protein [Verrucomicrobiae bacterium]